MKMEQLAIMSEQTEIRDLRQGRASINDIKWDMIRIIEPYDGYLDTSDRSERQIRKLFSAYLGDLKTAGLINDYSVMSNIRDSAITYDVAIKMSEDRSAKKLKIHVGVYQHPWIRKAA